MNFWLQLAKIRKLLNLNWKNYSKKTWTFSKSGGVPVSPGLAFRPRQHALVALDLLNKRMSSEETGQVCLPSTILLLIHHFVQLKQEGNQHFFDNSTCDTVANPRVRLRERNLNRQNSPGGFFFYHCVLRHQISGTLRLALLGVCQEPLRMSMPFWRLRITMQEPKMAMRKSQRERILLELKRSFFIAG